MEEDFEVPDNWYEKGQEKLIEELCEHGPADDLAVRRIYSYLSNIGLIDYDIEKEIIFNMYWGEEE